MIRMRVGEKDQPDREPVAPAFLEHGRSVRPAVENHGVFARRIPDEVGVYLHVVIRGVELRQAFELRSRPAAIRPRRNGERRRRRVSGRARFGRPWSRSKLPSRSCADLLRVGAGFFRQLTVGKPRPRCALPMISVKLSSSGMAMLSTKKQPTRLSSVLAARAGEDRRCAPWPGPPVRCAISSSAGAVPRLFFDRSHGDIRDAAGRDRVEGREVAAHVERETVHRDPMPHADADRGDFALLDPDAGQAGAGRGVDLVGREQLDQERFDPAQIAMQILPVAAQIEEKITDQLPGPVISRLPAAVDRDKRMRQMRGAAQARLIGRAADGVNRIVFEQPELVRQRPDPRAFA